MASYGSKATSVRQFMSRAMIPGMHIDEQSQLGKRDIRVSLRPFQVLSLDHCQLSNRYSYGQIKLLLPNLEI